LTKAAKNIYLIRLSISWVFIHRQLGHLFNHHARETKLLINPALQQIIHLATEKNQSYLSSNEIDVCNFESGLKTSLFGLKPSRWLIFNCPVRQLADGAIDIIDNQGFSHINEIFCPF